jgi:hypothetical protein
VIGVAPAIVVVGALGTVVAPGGVVGTFWD